MGHVENHADPLHFLEQGRPPRKQAAFRAGAVGIGTEPIMRRSDNAQASLPPFLDLFGKQNRIRAFHAEDKAERLPARRFAPVRPCLDMGLQPFSILDPKQITLLLQRPIIRHLSMCRGVSRIHRLVPLNRRHMIGAEEPS